MLNRILRTLWVMTVLLAGVAWMVSPVLALDDLPGTSWELVSIDGQPVVASTVVTLSFGADGQLSGNGGCNSYSGTYTFKADTLEVGAIISTLMMCMDSGVSEQETAYLQALGNAASVAQDGNQLIIMTGDGVELVFVKLASLEGTEWLLVTLGGDAVFEGSTISLTFLEESRLAGSSGCNRYSAGYTLAGDSVRVDVIASTLMMCIDEAVAQQEQVYLAALQGAFSLTVTDGSLVIGYEGGELVFMAAKVLKGSEWQLISIDGTDVAADSTLTLTFGEDGRISGDSGCNRFMGGYTAEGGTLSISEVASTRRACLSDALNTQEQAYLAALGAASSYTMSGDQLTIMTGDGVTLLFGASGVLTNVEWQLASVNGADVVAGSGTTLKLTEDGQIMGNGGCNSYGGSYTIEDSVLKVSDVFSTLRACDADLMAQEDALFAALQSSLSYSLSGGNLTLTNAEGVVLVFTTK